MPREDKSDKFPTAKESAEDGQEKSQSLEPICVVEESSIERPIQEVKESPGAIPEEADDGLVPENESERSLCSKCGKFKLIIDNSEDSLAQSQLSCTCSTAQEETDIKMDKDVVIEETAQMDITEAESKDLTTPGMSNELVHQVKSQVESIEEPSDCGSHELNKPPEECPRVAGADEAVNIEENYVVLSPGDSFRESRAQDLDSADIELNLQEPFNCVSCMTEPLNIAVCGCIFVILAIFALFLGLQILYFNRNGDDSEDIDRNSTRKR